METTHKLRVTPRECQLLWKFLAYGQVPVLGAEQEDNELLPDSDEEDFHKPRSRSTQSWRQKQQRRRKVTKLGRQPSRRRTNRFRQQIPPLKIEMNRFRRVKPHRHRVNAHKRTRRTRQQQEKTRRMRRKQVMNWRARRRFGCIRRTRCLRGRRTDGTVPSLRKMLCH